MWSNSTYLSVWPTLLIYTLGKKRKVPNFSEVPPPNGGEEGRTANAREVEGREKRLDLTKKEEQMTCW